MPPKSKMDPEDDSEEETDEEEEDEEEEEETDEEPVPAAKPAAADNDDEFEFDAPAKPAAGSSVLKNQTHDEAVDLGDDASSHVPTPTKASPTAAATKTKALSNQAHDEAMELSDGDSVDSSAVSPAAGSRGTGKAAGSAPAPLAGTKTLKNTAHDEEIDVDDGSEVSSDDAADDHQTSKSAIASPSHATSNDSITASETPAAAPTANLRPIAGAKPTALKPAKVRNGNDSDEESTSDDADDAGAPEPHPEVLEYNPADFAHLKVSKEIKDAFQFITNFKPQAVDLESRLKPFIPDYIPAVGDIDTFIKIPRPDMKADSLGLTVLDEPAAQQSNPSVVKIGLSYSSKHKHGLKADQVVDAIEYAQKKPQQVDKWIADVANLHRKKPATAVSYKNPMPDVEALLQVWPSDFEDLLSASNLELPGGDLDVELHQYVQFICALLDIPVYDNIIESLHVLFNVYSEFKANQHFSHHVEM